MIRLRISVEDWQVLSPLIDQALDLSVTERARWLSGQSALAAELRKKLEALLRERDAPETSQFMETLGSARALAAARDAMASTLRAGDLVGPYTLLRVVGHGGMGEVWLARRSDGAFQREVALKLPTTDHAPQRMRERLARERDVLASLEQSNIARFYDAGVSAEGQPFIAMEYVDGDTFTAYATAHKLDVAARCRLMLQVLGAVQYAHQRLIVHRDLKPSNILVRSNGQVALLDFGIAKVLDEATGEGTESQLTRETGRALTLAYAAPEQVLALPVTTATDVFACGVLFYELLSGARPFGAHEASLGTMIGAHDAPLKRMPGIKRGTMSRDLNAIVARALRREPNERYVSAAALSDDIKRFLDDEPVRAVRGAVLYALGKFIKRQRVALVVGTVGMTTALALGVSALVQWQSALATGTRAKAIERMVDGLLEGMSPEVAESKKFTAKELLDKAVVALGQDVERSNIGIRIAERYRLIGAYRKAEDVINGVLKGVDRTEAQRGDPRIDLQALIELAYIQCDDRRSDESLATIAKAREIDVQNSLPHLEAQHALARLAIIEGKDFLHKADLTRSERMLDQAIQHARPIQAAFPELLVIGVGLRAQVALFRLNPAEAERVLAAVPSLLNDGTANKQAADPLLMRARADVALETGQYSEARRILSTLLDDRRNRFDPTSEWVKQISLDLAYALILDEQFGDANRLLSAIMSAPDTAPSWFVGAHDSMIAFANLRRGDASIAAQMYRRLRNQSFQSRGYQSISTVRRDRHLAEALVREGKSAEAVTLLEGTQLQALNHHPDMRLDWAHVAFTRAIAQMRTSEFNAARHQLSGVDTLYREAFGTLSPRSEIVRFHLALIDPEATKASRLVALNTLALAFPSHTSPKKFRDWLTASESPTWSEMPVFFN